MVPYRRNDRVPVEVRAHAPGLSQLICVAKSIYDCPPRGERGKEYSRCPTCYFKSDLELRKSHTQEVARNTKGPIKRKGKFPYSGALVSVSLNNLPGKICIKKGYRCLSRRQSHAQEQIFVIVLINIG